MVKKLFFSGIIMVCAFYAQAHAADPAALVGEANKLYKKQKYGEALKLYEQALSGEPDSTIINFNAGTAHYKTSDYQKAVGSFEKSLATQDIGLESKANYNLGNSRYMLGLSKEDSDISKAIRLLEASLENYNRTMQLTPKDKDAKVNYRIVEKKLKELKEKLKQQPQPQQVSNKQQQQQDKRQQDQSQQQEGQQKQTSQAQKQNKQGPQKQREENKEQQADQPEQYAEPTEMSRQEANMLLEGFRQEENAAGMLRDKHEGVEERVLKDW